MGLCIHIYDWLSFSFAVFVGGLRIIKYHTLPSSTEESGKCLKILPFPNSAVGFCSKYFGALELCVCVCVCVCVSNECCQCFAQTCEHLRSLMHLFCLCLEVTVKLAFDNTAKSNISEKGKKNPFRSINCPSQCCSKVKYHHSLDVWFPPVKRD